MAELFQSLDLALFRFLNVTLGNPVTDIVMPFVTDLTVTWYGRVFFAGAWLLLLLRCGRRGRAAAILLVPLIVVSDQLSSSLVKQFVMRPRPCHLAGGVPMADQIRLLVGCGAGYSFPSSHAVNNFAAATFLTRYFPQWRWGLFGWAALVSLSRISVGVHWPSDVVGGMVIGAAVAWFFLQGWMLTIRQFPFLEPWGPPGGGERSIHRGAR